MIDNQMLMIYAINNRDMVDVLESETFPGKDFSNPFCALNYRVPIIYSSSRKQIHCALVPELCKIYKENKVSIRAQNGTYSFEKVLSTILDKVLFVAEDESCIFHEQLQVYKESMYYPCTAELWKYVTSEKFEAFKDLVSKVEKGIISTECVYTIGDLNEK